MSLPAFDGRSNYRVLEGDRDWKPFNHLDGFDYKILDVDVTRRTVDMLFRFEPDGVCFYHRHRSAVLAFVLEGEHHIEEIDDQGARVKKVRRAGELAYSIDGHPHIEGGGAQGGVIYFSFRGTDDHIYDILDEDLNLVREVSIHDFRKAYEQW
ncbi:MAG: hypothetical protein ACI8W7_000141 [Gammaproteobacteria bacterium]|jgi:hypothetical protein